MVSQEDKKTGSSSYSTTTESRIRAWGGGTRC